MNFADYGFVRFAFVQGGDKLSFCELASSLLVSQYLVLRMTLMKRSSHCTRKYMYSGIRDMTIDLRITVLLKKFFKNPPLKFCTLHFLHTAHLSMFQSHIHGHFDNGKWVNNAFVKKTTHILIYDKIPLLGVLVLVLYCLQGIRHVYIKENIIK